jgi:Zn-finger in ubiquitin-hydrolases and other protein
MSLAGVAGYRQTRGELNWKRSAKRPAGGKMEDSTDGVHTIRDAMVPGASLNGTAPRCEHLDAIVPTAPRASSSLECPVDSDIRAFVLACLSCGWVACSKDSPGNHALVHYKETDHPLAAALAQGSRFRWCYVHRRAV